MFTEEQMKTAYYEGWHDERIYPAFSDGWENSDTKKVLDAHKINLCASKEHNNGKG